MTLIICESLREIGEVACVTSAWSSRGQTLKTTAESKNSQAKKLRRRKRESKESGQHRGRRQNIAGQGLKEEYEIILNNAVRQS